MAGQQQQQGQEGGSMDLMWGVAFLVAIALLGWYFGRVPILKGLFMMKLGEIYLASFFTDTLEPARRAILTYYANPGVLTFSQVGEIFTYVGNVMRYPIAVVFVILAGIIFFRHPLLKFKTVYTMAKLRQSESVIWPQINPTMHLDLVSENIFEGPWAMPENPMEFAKRNRLIEELPVPIDPFLAKRGLIEINIISDRARVVFSNQMGPLLGDLNQLPIHTKALFGIFAARAVNDTKGANELMTNIARSCAKGKPDFTGAQELLRKHYNTKEISKIFSMHAYVYTMMTSLLEHARTNGVLATADFLWLKPIDRRLWYVLNCTGRHTAFCEIAGPFSHWRAEKALKRKVMRPMVDQAIVALNEAVKMIIYTRDED
jgi:intracellular multiplication protein IcmP